MPDFFAIMLKINTALILFCAGYYLVLRRLTFYTLNRAYLVTAILFSSAYPFIDLSIFAQRHQEIVAPVQNVVVIWKAPVENFVKQATYWNWLEVAFWTGVALFAIRLSSQLVSLYKIYRQSVRTEINGHAVRIVKGNITPFSFWQSIYISPSNLSPADLNNILLHEQIHVKEWHTLDILLAEISAVFYWFNPGIWMLKRAVRENIEFITDRKILLTGTNIKAYQYSLLNVTFNQSAPAITSNFNISTLKNRIKMMNAKRSSNLNLTRYALLVPMVIICVFIFTLSKADAVKNSPVFKAVAATAEKINTIALNNDTTPSPKKVTQITTKAPNSSDNAATGVEPSGGLKIASDTAIVKSSGFKFINNNLHDSVVFLVDGKKISNTELHNIDMGIVKSVDVVQTGSVVSDLIQKIPGLALKAANVGKPLSLVMIKTTAEKAVNVNSNTSLAGYATNKSVTIRTWDATDPNSDPKVSSVNTYDIKNRTIAEILSGRNPVIVIDDKIVDFVEASKIRSDNIYSVEILKGSNITGIYGNKAENGVIIISTKNK